MSTTGYYFLFSVSRVAPDCLPHEVRPRSNDCFLFIASLIHLLRSRSVFLLQDLYLHGCTTIRAVKENKGIDNFSAVNAAPTFIRPVQCLGCRIHEVLKTHQPGALCAS